MKFNASIDLIEDGVATLMPTNTERSPLTVPQGLLPKGAREGHILSINIEMDDRATGEADQRAAWLFSELQKKNRRGK